MRRSAKIIQFNWDRWNTNKNWEKHQVSNQECEEIFFDSKKKLLSDAIHSVNEKRYILLGKTKLERLLFIVFVIRKNQIRIISARDFNKNEKHLYKK